ncbi:hypothetical protein QJQ45_014475 [Haematococcus lacustris]|nr:hypothetical protein QJQ45_014475 [Haematococcus lacustris]
MGVWGLKDFAAEHDGKTVQSAVRLNAGNNRLIKLKHKHPSNGLGLELQAKQWGATYDLATKDVSLDLTRKTGWGLLKVSQRLPRHQLFLLPSPTFKLTATPVSGPNKYKLKTTWELSHDFQKGVASLAEEVVVDGRYKARLAMDTATVSGVAQWLHLIHSYPTPPHPTPRHPTPPHPTPPHPTPPHPTPPHPTPPHPTPPLPTFLALLPPQRTKGVSLALTAALGRPWASSLGVTLSQSGGPVLRYEADVGAVGSKTKVRADLRVKTKDVKLEVLPYKFGRMGLNLSAVLRTDKLAAPKWVLGTNVNL